MLIWQKKLWESAIFHSIKLPFDAEVDEKFLNVIYSIRSLVCMYLKHSLNLFFPDRTNSFLEICIVCYTWEYKGILLPLKYLTTASSWTKALTNTINALYWRSKTNVACDRVFRLGWWIFLTFKNIKHLFYLNTVVPHSYATPRNANFAAMLFWIGSKKIRVELFSFFPLPLSYTIFFPQLHYFPLFPPSYTIFSP